MSASPPSSGPVAALRRFLASDTSAGLVLTGAAVLALVVSNSPLAHAYHTMLEARWMPGIGPVAAPVLTLPVHAWINDFWMAVFFFVVGLEIRREVSEGELSTREQALLPAVCALGGMLVPALVCFALNAVDPVARRAWAVPMATDIAFALGVLSLVGRHLPSSLKVFLTALAIIDDLGAIIVIAAGYTASLDLVAAAAAAALALVLLALNRAGVTRVGVYAVVGLALWVAVLRSGVHPTVAGVLTAFAVPVRDADGNSPNIRTQHALHPWVSFVVLPLFAFANAGVSFSGLGALASGGGVAFVTLPAGIALGLVGGKLAGVYGSAAWCVRRGWAAWPAGATPRQFAGVAALCGIGFTMSLFIGDLAVGGAGEAFETAIKLGVFGGSIVAGALGAWLLRR